MISVAMTSVAMISVFLFGGESVVECATMLSAAMRGAKMSREGVTRRCHAKTSCEDALRGV